MMLMITTLERPPLSDRLRVYGSRVKDARVLEGLRAGSVAEALQIGATRYSRLEAAGTSSPVSREELAALSDVLHFDEDYFLSPTVTVVERTGLCFRAKKSMTRLQEDQIGAWARLCGELVHTVLAGSGDSIKMLLPQLDPRTSPQLAALTVRDAIGLTVDGPIAQLTRSLERAGVYIFSAEFAAEAAARHDAVSLWVGEAKQHPIVMVRASDSWERTRMSLAHEVGHLVLHRYSKPEDAEDAAFAFAGEFLMPSQQIEKEWPSHATLESLLPMKLKWGVSLSALIEQGHRLGLLTVERRRSLYKQLSARRQYPSGRTWREQEPGFDQREVEKPLLITRLIERAYAGNISIETLRRMISSWPARYVSPLIEGQFRPPAGHINSSENVTSIFARTG